MRYKKLLVALAVSVMVIISCTFVVEAAYASEPNDSSSYTLQITNKNILEKVEKLPEIEEKILNLKEQEEEIISLNNSINLAKTVLEEAYEKMKENITPEFVINLSKMVKEIS